MLKGHNLQMKIRAITQIDREGIREIYMSAFAEDERALVAGVAEALLDEVVEPEIISFVAEIDGELVGHVGFSPVFVEDDVFEGYILAPLAVRPAYQKQGVGSELVKTGIQFFRGRGVGMIFVYGDPGYYGRLGFNVDAALKYQPGYKLQYPNGWQGLVLVEREENSGPVTIRCVEALNDPALW